MLPHPHTNTPTTYTHTPTTYTHTPPLPTHTPPLPTHTPTTYTHIHVTPSLMKLVYSLGYVLIYYGYFSREMSSRDSHKLPTQSITQTLPGPDGAKVSLKCLGSQKLIFIDYFTHLSCTIQKWFDSYLTHLSWSFFKQSLLKQILTDGRSYATLSLSSTLSQTLSFRLSLSFHNPVSPLIDMCLVSVCR